MVVPLLGIFSLALYLGLLGVKAYLSLRIAGQAPQGSRDEETTILQPILSGDPLLEKALQHNLSVVPTWARFLWLIDEDDTVARQLAQVLIHDADQASRGKSVRVLLCPAVPPQVNPKLFKLEYALSQIETPYLAVLDDDTLLEPDTLSIGLSQLQNGDLFTGLPYYLQGSTGWSELTAHFVNNNSILTYLPLLNFFNPISLNGMFYLMDTETLRQMGGFTPILHDLCDDYALARLLKQQGGRIIQGTTPIAIQTSVPDAQSYLKLMHRWFVFAQTLVFDQPAPTQALLFLFLGVPPLLLWISLLSLIFSSLGLLCLLAVLIIRHVTIRHLHRQIFAKPVAFSFVMSITSELLQPFHLTHALLEKRIRWRNRLIRVGKSGKFSYEQP
ncbi:MAG: glycosyltransferase [Oscillatoriophycideae cyanobacterium NC_groundwater_1537_Pr4_S-0.65um_50_18]|nr:glycosyltransferase [Oscillatoriophycideae cyanobacterium NC_groundwater_1537_Pr4_S-0.65um_50_18]